MSLADQIRAKMQGTAQARHPCDTRRDSLRKNTDMIIGELLKTSMEADPEATSWEQDEKRLLLLCKKLALVTKGLVESYEIDRREAEAIAEAKRQGSIAKCVKITTWQGKRIPAQ